MGFTTYLCTWPFLTANFLSWSLDIFIVIVTFFDPIEVIHSIEIWKESENEENGTGILRTSCSSYPPFYSTLYTDVFIMFGPNYLQTNFLTTLAANHGTTNQAPGEIYYTKMPRRRLLKREAHRMSARWSKSLRSARTHSPTFFYLLN